MRIHTSCFPNSKWIKIPERDETLFFSALLCVGTHVDKVLILISVETGGSIMWLELHLRVEIRWSRVVRTPLIKVLLIWPHIRPVFILLLGYISCFLLGLKCTNFCLLFALKGFVFCLLLWFLSSFVWVWLTGVSPPFTCTPALDHRAFTYLHTSRPRSPVRSKKKSPSFSRILWPRGGCPADQHDERHLCTAKTCKCQ